MHAEAHHERIGLQEPRALRSVFTPACRLTAMNCDYVFIAGSFQYFQNSMRSSFSWGHMPQYLIERDIPGAGKLTSAELKTISQKSCGVLNQLGPQIQWVESYVTGDRIYCVYRAPNEEMVREHARQGGFPANRVSEIKTIIDPTTAE
jgi:uncharacterized protein DUF4242